MYEILFSNQFKRSYKKCLKRGFNKASAVKRLSGSLTRKNKGITKPIPHLPWITNPRGRMTKEDEEN